VHERSKIFNIDIIPILFLQETFLEVVVSEVQDHLIIVKGPRVGEKIPLSNLPITIGREESVEVPITLESISRRHLRVTKLVSGYAIEDLKSSNGTYVNDERIEKPRQIKNGDVIALGADLELRLVIPVVQDANATVFGVSSKEQKNGNATVFMKPSVGTDQTVAFVEMPVAPVVPPRLVINESGQESRIVTITTDRVRIGRQEDSDVVLTNRFISRRHADLEKRGQDYFLIPSTNASNTLLLDGQPVMEATRLHNGAKIRLGGYAPGEIVTLDFLSPANEGQQVIKFKENSTMTIGRDASNAIVLTAPAVSRFHAEVEKVGQRYRVRDLRSSNGTYVNGHAVTGEMWVHPGDAIQIGPYRFVVAENELSQSDQSEGVSVDIIGLNKWVSKSLNILQDISLAFKPKEFVVVVGQSGGGKSTLVDAIAGYRPATHGRIVVNKTIDVYKEFNAIRSTIGYVPQKDIIHMELTVFQALNYAARLRMPADTTEAERLKRIDEVMDDLDLKHRRDTQISQLSGGQQKRVSIGVELLTKPGLFFLDEPTSGLDPGMETELMRLMRRLADQGRTIVMITHATKNVMLADKVVFLARGGFLAWFGPPEEALAYFDKYRTERDRRAGAMEFDHIYTLLDQDELGSAADWADRFRKDPAYGKYILEHLSGGAQPGKAERSQTVPKVLSQRNQVSALRQFFVLSARNVKILTRDWFGLFLLLATAPIMASLDFMVASGIGHDPFGFKNGNFNNVVVTMIVFTNTTMLVGGLSFMRELVKEREIYKRERMVNLKLSSYIMSKIWVALLLAVYQTFCYTAIRYLAFDMPGGIEELVFVFITAYLLIFAGMMLGLFASALAPNANAAPLLLVMFIIPQMVLSGAIMPLPTPARAPASSSWAFQGIVAISGAGSDVARDSCWALPADQRDTLTLDQKNSQCICMGDNALRQNSCNFPGVGSYYDVAIDTKDPVKPADSGPKPAEPVLPTKPADPASPNNLQALQAYLHDLNVYNDQVAKLQDDYKQKINTWQDSQETYKADIETYQKNLTELKVKRAVAVGAAESTIKKYKEDFGWTFVDKKDRSSYLKVVFGAWGAQLIIILVLFVGTLIMQKRRDVV
jgi:ABC-type multidrug transport system ATPase subunit/pSer/pThr/pTyr-binding forkhead associated (FHA) protein/ABC-type multidrug transport system permease subunit